MTEFSFLGGRLICDLSLKRKKLQNAATKFTACYSPAPGKKQANTVGFISLPTFSHPSSQKLKTTDRGSEQEYSRCKNKVEIPAESSL